MTDAPERIWAIGFTGEAWNVGKWSRQDTRAFYPDAERYIRADLLDAHIGAVIDEAAEAAWQADSLELQLHGESKIAERIRALRPNAMQALERVRREARVEGMERLPEYLVSFEKDNSFRLGQVQGFIYGDDCVVRDCWLPAGEQEVLRKPASEITSDEMMDFIHAYRLRLAIRALIAAEERGEGE